MHRQRRNGFREPVNLRGETPYSGKRDDALTFNLGEAKAAILHSRMWELDLIHQERYTGIKSAYDLKNKEGEGQHGLILEYRYVPVKNVMFDWRWMHYKAINCKAASQYTGNQYRFQLYYYF